MSIRVILETSDFSPHNKQEFDLPVIPREKEKISIGGWLYEVGSVVHVMISESASSHRVHLHIRVLIPGPRIP